MKDDETTASRYGTGLYMVVSATYTIAILRLRVRKGFFHGPQTIPYDIYCKLPQEALHVEPFIIVDCLIIFSRMSADIGVPYTHD
jgi:hypothetical protein